MKTIFFFIDINKCNNLIMNVIKHRYFQFTSSSSPNLCTIWNCNGLGNMQSILVVIQSYVLCKSQKSVIIIENGAEVVLMQFSLRLAELHCLLLMHQPFCCAFKNFSCWLACSKLVVMKCILTFNLFSINSRHWTSNSVQLATDHDSVFIRGIWTRFIKSSANSAVITFWSCSLCTGKASGS